MSLNGGTFLQELGSVITGKGFKKIISGVGVQFILESTGSKLDDTTTPAMGALETNGFGLIIAAGATAAGTLNFVIPQDYDESLDYLRIRILAQSAGDTNTPTIDATIYRKRAGAALSSDLDPTISGATSTNTVASSYVEINADGNTLQGGDALHATLTTSAHATDALHIYAVEVVYKSDLVYFDKADRGG